VLPYLTGRADWRGGTATRRIEGAWRIENPARNPWAPPPHLIPCCLPSCGSVWTREDRVTRSTSHSIGIASLDSRSRPGQDSPRPRRSPWRMLLEAPGGMEACSASATPHSSPAAPSRQKKRATAFQDEEASNRAPSRRAAALPGLPPPHARKGAQERQTRRHWTSVFGNSEKLRQIHPRRARNFTADSTPGHHMTPCVEAKMPRRVPAERGQRKLPSNKAPDPVQTCHKITQLHAVAHPPQQFTAAGQSLVRSQEASKKKEKSADSKEGAVLISLTEDAECRDRPADRQGRRGE